jgi:hypothetical protein
MPCEIAEMEVARYRSRPCHGDSDDRMRQGLVVESGPRSIARGPAAFSPVVSALLRSFSSPGLPYWDEVRS